MAFQNPTEEFVFNLCRRSFLSLWSYANPRREGSSQELCDILVVCEPHVLILSVKYSAYQEAKGHPEIAASRWLRETVERSVKGIYGAERNLVRATHVTRSDGQQGLPLPSLTDRKVHRISVSLGGKRLVSLSSGDYGKGFVHCFDDYFVQIALGELDTISDFIAYLEAKEGLYQQQRVVMKGGEEDLLAVYLHKGRSFPQMKETTVPDDLWETFFRNAAYQRRLEAERVSYIWDRLIEYLADHVLAERMELGGTLSDNELVLRVMARENRLARRILGEDLQDFLDKARKREVRARIVPSTSCVTYVFFNAPPTYDRQSRFAELQCRCIVARGEIPENTTVVGIGVNVEPAPQGYAEDLILFSCPEWTIEDQRHADEIKQELGFFKTPLFQRQQVDEYPEE